MAGSFTTWSCLASRELRDTLLKYFMLIGILHSHHHYPHLLHKEQSREKEALSSHQNLQPHDPSTKSEVVTPEESRAGSRRTSVFGDMAGWEKMGNGERGMGEKRVVKEGEVKEERERGILRATFVPPYRFLIVIVILVVAVVVNGLR